jgi:hypothetical protein
MPVGGDDLLCGGGIRSGVLANIRHRTAARSRAACSRTTLIRPGGIKGEGNFDRPRSLDCFVRAVAQRLEGGKCFAHHPAATFGLRREGNQPRFVVGPTRHIDRRPSWSKYASIKAIERISAVKDLTRNRS